MTFPFSTFNDPRDNQNNPCYGAAQQKQPFHIAVNCADFPYKEPENRQWYPVANTHIHKVIRKKSKDANAHRTDSRLEQPGNLPDVTSVTRAINQLSALGVSTTEMVTDNGYYSEQNFSELLWLGMYRNQAEGNTTDIHRVICIRVESFQDSETDTFASILAMFQICAVYQ